MIFLPPNRIIQSLARIGLMALLVGSMSSAVKASTAAPNANAAASLKPPAPIDQKDVRLGQSTYYWFLFRLYSAELWAPTAVQSMDQLWQTPFALTLTYDIPVKPTKLAQVTLEQMELQAAVEPTLAQQWVQKLSQLYPPIDPGTTLVGLYDPSGRMALYRDGQLLGEIKDGDFAKRFFMIWLDARSSYPKNRLQLLGWKGGAG